MQYVVWRMQKYNHLQSKVNMKDRIVSVFNGDGIRY